MEKVEHEKLEKEMYDVANEIVGVSEIDNSKFVNSIGERYTHFIIHTNDLHEVPKIWSEWIESYCAFTRLAHKEFRIVERNPQLIVRWFLPPKIEVEEDRIVIRALLTISRLDFHPDD